MLLNDKTIISISLQSTIYSSNVIFMKIINQTVEKGFKKKGFNLSLFVTFNLF